MMRHGNNFDKHQRQQFKQFIIKKKNKEIEQIKNVTIAAIFESDNMKKIKKREKIILEKDKKLGIYLYGII